MLALLLNLLAPQVDTPVLWACQADSLFQGTYRLLHAGYDLSAEGDFDGDGRRDVLLGGMNPWDRSLTDPGGVLLFQAPFAAAENNEKFPVPNLSFSGARGGERFGWCAKLVGDLDGDGRSEIAIGAPRAWNSGSRDPAVEPSWDERGAVFLYFSSDLPVSGDGALPGGTTLGPERARFVIAGDRNNARLGWTLLGIPDVDGDGLGELVLGAPGGLEGAPVAGGSIALLTSKAIAAERQREAGPRAVRSLTNFNARVFHGIDTEDRFGSSLAWFPGIMNAELAAFPDGEGPLWPAGLLVGAPEQRPVPPRTPGADGNGNVPAGDGYATLLSRGALEGQAEGLRLILAPPTQGNSGYFGFALAAGFDADHDGVSELLVGEPNFDASPADDALRSHGRTSLYSGRTGQLLNRWSGSQAGSELGYAVCALGRASDDHYDDFAVAARLFSPGQPIADQPPCPSDPRLGSAAAGAVYWYEGQLTITPEGQPAPPRVRLLFLGQDGRDRLGMALCSPGDLNGDGFADLATAAPAWPDERRGHDDWEEVGRAYLFHLGPQAEARAGKVGAAPESLQAAAAAGREAPGRGRTPAGGGR